MDYSWQTVEVPCRKGVVLTRCFSDLMAKLLGPVYPWYTFSGFNGYTGRYKVEVLGQIPSYTCTFHWLNALEKCFQNPSHKCSLEDSQVTFCNHYMICITTV